MHVAIFSKMHRPQFLHGLAFQRVRDAMPVALLRMQFKARQSHPLARLDPALIEPWICASDSVCWGRLVRS